MPTKLTNRNFRYFDDFEIEPGNPAVFICQYVPAVAIAPEIRRNLEVIVEVSGRFSRMRE